MINGTHILFYSESPEADRAFLRDVLGFKSVDAGQGWLIFALPPAEAGVHPADGQDRAQGHGGRSLLGAVVYLMCDNVQEEVKRLQEKNVSCSPLEDEGWGIKTSFRLPSGGELGLYQPRHPTAFDMKPNRA